MATTLDEINQLIKNDKIEEAEQLARKLLIEVPDNIDLKILLARALAIQDKLIEASNILDELIKTDDKNFEALYLLAQIKESQKEYDTAISLYHRLAGIDNSNARVYYRLGKLYTAYEFDGKSDYLATQYLKDAVSKENPPIGAFITLSNLEKSQRALYVLQNGIKRYPKDASLHNAICMKLYSAENYSECLQAISDARNQGVNNDQLDCLEFLSFYGEKQYKEALEKLTQYDYGDEQKAVSFRCFEGLLRSDAGDLNNATLVLQQIIKDDVKDVLDYLGHIILTRTYIRNLDMLSAEKVFGEIPMSQRFDRPMYLFVGFSAIDVEKYFLDTLAEIISSDLSAETITKAKFFRAAYDFSPYVDTSNFTVEQLKEIKGIFHEALKLSPRDSRIYSDLYAVSFQLGNLIEAMEFYFLSELYEDSFGYRDLDNKVLEGVNKSSKTIEKLLSLVDKTIENDRFTQNKFSERCLKEIISFFHTKGKYQVVASLAKKFSYTNISDAEVVFEVAYAYSQTENKKLGKEYYKAYLRDIGDNSAVLNNLAILEEEDGSVAEAERLFNHAVEIDPSNEKAKNNLSRVTQRIQKEEEQKRLYQKANDLFVQETDVVKTLSATLFSLRTSDGLIYCNEDKLSEMTGLDFEELEFRVGELIKKKYFDEIINQSIRFEGKILRANPYVAPLLENEQKQAEEKRLISTISNDLMSENLYVKFGYGKDLLEKLSIVKAPQLSKMLERDLYETVVSLAVKSYKSTLILCGSVVEAVLLDQLAVREAEALNALERLLIKDGKALKGDDKNLQRWVLDRLLDVSLELKIISENLYHWGHGLRGFRNLVHPGVEQRQTMEVSRENAEMAWNVVKRLFSEIKSKDKA